MRLCITFTGNRIKLPIATAHCLQGLLYRAFASDANFATTLHNEGTAFENRRFKLFTFSELSGRYEIQDGCIVYPSEARLFVDSANDYAMNLLFSYFSENNTVMLGDNRVTVANVTLQKTTVADHVITVKTLSPITVYRTDESGYTHYFGPEDPAFYEAVIQNAKRKWISHMGSEEGFSLSVTPAENARFKKRATRFKETFINAWHGTFSLCGNPETLTFLYQTGLGSKNSQGFGMFEITK